MPTISLGVSLSTLPSRKLEPCDYTTHVASLTLQAQGGLDGRNTGSSSRSPGSPKSELFQIWKAIIPGNPENKIPHYREACNFMILLNKLCGISIANISVKNGGG